MKKYNIFYKVGNRIVQKSNVSKEEVRQFLASLKKEDESELRVIEVKEKGDEER